MSCIHYKFKSSLDYDSVTFDGLHLSLSDLKKAIGQKKRLKPGEFDLEITNAQTGDVYKKNDELIAKNTSVIVSRIPVVKTSASNTQKSWEAFKLECAKVKEQERQNTLGKQKQIPDQTHAPTSEIDKIKAVIDQSTKGFEPSNFAGKYQSGVPHDHYVCKRCLQKGHFVANCPNSNPEDRYIEPRYKRTTGIPSTMLTIVDDPLHPGALLTHHGQFAVPTVDVLGYREVKKERPPFLPFEKHPEPEKRKIPQELLCHICEDLCVDAAIAPCCGTSFCDECLREVLLESDDHKCPSCKETNVSPDKIVPNRSMRLAVTNFLNDTGYTKAKKRRSSSQNGEPLYQAPPSSNKPPSPRKHEFRTSPQSSPNNNSSPTYNDSGNKHSHAPPTNVSTHSFAPRNNPNNGQSAQFRPQFNYSKPPMFPQNQFSKPWRFPAEQQSVQGSSISTISRRSDVAEGSYNRSHATEPPPASQIVDTTGFTAVSTASSIDKSSHIEPVSSGPSNVLSRPNQKQPPMMAQTTWPPVTNQMMKTPNLPPNTSVSLLALGAVLGARQPQLLIPLQGQPFHGGGFPFGYPAPRPNLPRMPQAVQSTGVPLSREEFYQAKKMFETSEMPEKKPVDVFESFADFTRRRSRTPERRRSYSRSRSRSWSKRGSRTPSISPGKARSRSLSPRRFSPHSRSRSRQRSPNRSRSKSPARLQNRSRSRSGPRLTNRSRSRSFESSRLPRHRPQTHPLNRLSKSRSRSRSGPRLLKALSKSPRPSLSPLRRSPKSPLPPLRSCSRSFGRLTRSRSKSWSKRARSRSYSRPKSPRPLSRSPRRSPKLSPYRSPFRKRTISPRRRSPSFSPRRRSPYRSRSRTPLSKRKLSRSRTRSPIRRRSYTPQISPPRSNSPYRKPLSPIPFKRHSPSPFRGRGGYRGRGRGGFGYRDKFRGYRSPPEAIIPSASNITLSTGNLPPVPYFPQMGLPPPEEYFKYNPDGYQEFVRSFYAQLGPQTQSWAQSQTFPLGAGERFPLNIPGSNTTGLNQRPPWESVPMSPSQRPRSLTPPMAGPPQDKKDPIYNKDRDSHSGRYWDKDRDKIDHERNRPRDRRPERGRGIDRYRGRDMDRVDRFRDDERYRGRDSHRDRDNRDIESHRDRDNRDIENSRHRDKSTERKRTPPRRLKEEDKLKDKGRKKPDKGRDEKDVKKTKKSEPESRKESADPKESIVVVKTIPVSDKASIPTKTEQKVTVRDSAHTSSEPRDKPQADNSVSTGKPETAAPNSQSDATISKPPAKEKKNVNKKKGDGVASKKKAKEVSAEDGGEKKVKKTKKKKLTFGASDVDTKQGLKKKKLKRLVDYKSENCTSEDGEERISLGGSPLKKSKLAEINQVKEETVESTKSDKVDNTNTPIAEPTVEISTDIKNVQEASKTIKQETTEAAISQSVGKPAEEKPAEKLAPELPELSKWERDDVFDYYDTTEHTKEKPQGKMMLPRSVVDKAEKFLSHKPMKNAVVAHITTSTRSPEPALDKHAADRSSSPLQSKSSRRVFIEPRRDSKEKRQGDLQITVKADKRKEYPDRRGSTSSKSEDHHRHYHHHREHDGYDEDQRSVVKSSSLERDLQDSKASSRTHKDRDGYSRRDRFSHGSVGESNQRQDSSKRDKNESSREKHRNKSPEPRERRPRENNPAGHSDASKSSKDLRHKLEEKNKSKSTEDQRKLSVMDESEFVPDYEDLGPDGTNDNEQDEAAASQNSESSTSETNEHKDKKKNTSNDEGEKGDEKKASTDEAGKIKKSKKKHKHKEKKEKHKHKKKKKHKKEKDGGKQLKTNKDDGGSDK